MEDTAHSYFLNEEPFWGNKLTKMLNIILLLKTEKNSFDDYSDENKRWMLFLAKECWKRQSEICKQLFWEKYYW